MATDKPMQLGMIGLGRMGANLVRRLMRDGHRCVVYDVNADAIKALRGRAETAAGLLGLQFDAFKSVRLDAPAPIGAMRAMAAAQPAPQARPPSAEAESIDVSATVEADVLLKPP